MKKVTIYSMLILFLLNLITSGCGQTAGDSGLNLYTFPGEGDRANSYIISDGPESAIIDPASSEEIITKLKTSGLKPDYIILTHGHFDHIKGIAGIIEEYPGLKVLVNDKDRDKLADPQKNVSAMFGTDFSVKVQTSPINEGDKIKLAKTSVEVLETPGHTEGSVTLKAGNLLFTGDTLFKGSVGRTDFPGSSAADLESSLKKLSGLPDSLQVLPGHGEATFLGEEKRTNPFLQKVISLANWYGRFFKLEFLQNS